MLRNLFTTGLLFLLTASSAFGQSAAIGYQGRLTEAGNLASGIYDMQFRLFDTAAVGTGAQQGSTITKSAVLVTNGVFTVTLDFGAGVFTGPARWLEVGVRRNGGGGFTSLIPRQTLLPIPYAIYAGSAGSVPNGTVAAGQLNTGGLAPAPGQILSYDGGKLSWRDPATVSGSVFSLNGTSAYYNAGNVGIGTTVPATALEANGIVRSTRSGLAIQYIQLDGGDPASIKLTAQSAFAAEKALLIQNLSGEATPGANNSIQFAVGTTASPSTKMTLTRDGNVGIGTTTPTSKLEIAAQDGLAITGFQPYLTLRDTSAGNARSIIQNGGGNLLFYPESFAGRAPALSIFSGSGNVGIGTTTPVAKLHAETSLANTAAVYGNATGAGGVGVYGQSANGPAVHAEGNAVQARDKGGFVKAMIYVNVNGTIARCYNGVTGSSTGGCGITVDPFGNGVYRINFGFRVDDRFISITAQKGGGGLAGYNYGANFIFVDATTVDVLTFDANEGDDTYPQAFMIFVF